MKNSTIFWLWLSASVVGWFLGRYIGGIAADAVSREMLKVYHTSSLLLAWVVMFVIGGILVSIIQSVFLPDPVSRRLGEWGPAGWAAASVPAWIIGGVVAIAFGTIMNFSDEAVGYLSPLIPGVVAGIAQWFILRTTFRRASEWIVASAISMLVVTVGYTLDTACMGLLMGGTLAGVVTGGVMLSFVETWAGEQQPQPLTSRSAAGGEQRVATPDLFIGRRAAIDIALRISSASYPEMSGTLTKPKNVWAELTTLVEATQRLTGSDDVGAGYSPDMAVWLVTMDRIWTDEFPRPTDTPAPEPYHHYGVILNASSGESISIPARS